MIAGRKLLYLVTEDWYFHSHRRQLALAALRHGYVVALATRVGRYREQLEADGITVVPISLRRRSLNPLREASAICEIAKIYRRLRPDIVHHVGMKPVIYGTFAAQIAGVATVVNALGGLGYVFSSGEWFARLLRPVVRWMLRLVANRPHSRLIMQTDHDRRIVESSGVKPDTITVIRGAGVDLREFQPSPEPGGEPVVLLACRLLWDKGVGDFVETARRLRAKGLAARFVLVGQPDPDNPRSIPTGQIDCWQKDGHIEWWGQRDDMPAVFAASVLVCLPTVYGEGVPKVLIEAAACARPLVATDLPGCREIVRHNDNGLIVPTRDPVALADAIESLLANRERRMQMGYRGRAIAEAEFGIESVVDQTLSVYQKVM